MRKQKKTRCATHVEFRKRTFLENSHVSIFQIICFMKHWVGNITLLLIAELGISYKSAINLSSFCREVVFDAMIVKSQKLERRWKNCGNRRVKIWSKKISQGASGGRPVGLWSLRTWFWRSFHCLWKIGSHTITPIIQKWIEAGITIISDFWKAYDCLRVPAF